jgi:hypothetical protein
VVHQIYFEKLLYFLDSTVTVKHPQQQLYIVLPITMARVALRVRIYVDQPQKELVAALGLRSITWEIVVSRLYFTQ